MKLGHAGAPLPFEPGKAIGNVYYGVCSWTDRTLIEGGMFYPETATDRLSFYANAFPTKWMRPTMLCLRNATPISGESEPHLACSSTSKPSACSRSILSGRAAA